MNDKALSKWFDDTKNDTNFYDQLCILITIKMIGSLESKMKEAFASTNV